MSQEALTAFIADYIAGRRQAKLEAFDKVAAKRQAQGNDAPSIEIAEQRRELELQMSPRNWLTDAARRAGQISLVTHAAKFTHGDSKSSSIYSQAPQDGGYLSSASLDELASDAIGNAAALDVAKLLQTEVEGDSLLARLKANDISPLAAFAENTEQLTAWQAGFAKALSVGEPTSHKLAKQVYFPVDGGYHLLSPLFATSLTHAMHQRIQALRFGDEVKAIWQARREKTWHEKPLVTFPALAQMHFGGTKPQNISLLNSQRGGRTWLLPAAPPVWKDTAKAPKNITTLFAYNGVFNRRAGAIVMKVVGLLTGTGHTKNHRIREARDGYIDEIIDLLFEIASGLQREDWQGWTQQCPNLKPHQMLWLDPWRTKIDEGFAQERDKDDWQDAVMDDFARWFNQRLSKYLPDVGQEERREWKTRPRFQEQMRDMEHIIKEVLR